jgi:hypothetical protein
MQEAHADKTSLVLCNEKRKKRTGLDAPAGCVRVKKWSITKKPSFIDYIMGGLQVDAVDLFYSSAV